MCTPVRQTMSAEKQLADLCEYNKKPLVRQLAERGFLCHLCRYPLEGRCSYVGQCRIVVITCFLEGRYLDLIADSRRTDICCRAIGWPAMSEYRSRRRACGDPLVGAERATARNNIVFARKTPVTPCPFIGYVVRRCCPRRWIICVCSIDESIDVSTGR